MLNSDLQGLAVSAIITLFELDLSAIDPAQTTPLRFCGDSLPTGAVVWKGNTYSALPIEGSGFELRTSGQQPSPTLKIANIGGLLSSYLKQYQDLYGAQVTRIRTLAKYLDGMTTADPTAELPRDYYRVERKTAENKLFVELELASVLDADGVKLPRRIIAANSCGWRYRGPECNYSGGPVAKIDDTATSDAALDSCGKRRSSCALRNNLGNYGGFPGASLIL